MDWVNIHISTLADPACVGSSPAELGTWLRVLAYACTIECGGRIIGARTWKDAQWIRACQVTHREIKASYRLLRFDGDDLLVNGYPVRKEATVRQARGAGMAGAMARWQKNAAAMATAMDPPMPEDANPPMPGANAEGKGREEKGKGSKTPPPAIVENVENPKALIRLLRQLGELGADDKAVAEWSDLMTGRGKCLGAEEILEGVQWLVDNARRQGVTVQYARHVPAKLVAKWAQKLLDRDKLTEATT